MGKQCAECNQEGIWLNYDANGDSVWLCPKHHAHETGIDCDIPECQQCCEHQDTDDGFCLLCGKDVRAEMLTKACEPPSDLY